MNLGIFAGSIVLAFGVWPTEVHPHRMIGLTLGGFRVQVMGELVREPTLCAPVLEALRSDLAEIGRVVPEPAMAMLRDRVTIWVELQGAVVPGGMSGRGMVFHPSADWLRENGLDPERAGGVEIVRAQDFLDWRDAQPMMVLHELAHAYHHLIGIDHEQIVAAYEAAKVSGEYDSVGYVLAPEGEGRPAYAMRNATEYFSELSEAYFGRNDYEPFDWAGLRAFDPGGFAVVESVWSMDRESLAMLVDRDKAIDGDD